MIWVRGFAWHVYFHFLWFGHREELGGKRDSAVLNLIGGNTVWTSAILVGAKVEGPTGRKSLLRRLSGKNLQCGVIIKPRLPKFERWRVGGTQRDRDRCSLAVDFTLKRPYFGPHAPCSAACSMQGDNDETSCLVAGWKPWKVPKCRGLVLLCALCATVPLGGTGAAGVGSRAMPLPMQHSWLCPVPFPTILLVPYASAALSCRRPPPPLQRHHRPGHAARFTVYE